MLVSLLWSQRVSVWIDSWGQRTVTTQWAATKELISNQLLTCFCPAPFIWFECRAGYQLNMSYSYTHSHTHTTCCLCVWFSVNLNYCRVVWGNPVILADWVLCLWCEKCIQRVHYVFNLVQVPSKIMKGGAFCLTALSHKRAIMMLWLYFWEVLMSFIFIHSLDLQRRTSLELVRIIESVDLLIH